MEDSKHLQHRPLYPNHLKIGNNEACFNKKLFHRNSAIINRIPVNSFIGG